MTSRHCASVISSNATCGYVPTPLTSTSSRPNCSWHAATLACAPCSLVTSTPSGAATSPPPSSFRTSATVFAAATSASATRTRAPSDVRRRHHMRPILPAAPVTTTARPASRGPAGGATPTLAAPRELVVERVGPRIGKPQDPRAFERSQFCDVHTRVAELIDARLTRGAGDDGRLARCERQRRPIAPEGHDHRLVAILHGCDRRGGRHAQRGGQRAPRRLVERMPPGGRDEM